MALGNISILDINDNELVIKDAELTEIVNEIITAIGANNTSISERINDLHNRSFDAQIKISSANETEISNIVDGLYKVQYVTITGEGTEATETLNNSAILIQKGTNQYLIKDGQISSRTKTNDTWGTWTSAIPNDSNLVHKTGDETIGGDKTFTGDITGTFYGGFYSSHAEFSDLVGILPEASLNIVSEPYNIGEGTDALLIVGNPKGNPDGETPEEQATGGWTQIYNSATNKTLQDELDERNNVQADWNQTITTAYDYIKNKPTIPTVSTTISENDTNPVSGGAVYAKFADLIGSAPAALDTLQEIAYALNNDADLAGTLTTQISTKIPKVSNPTTGNFAALASDGTLVDSSYTYSNFLTEHQSIKTVNNESLIGTGNVVVSGLPQVSASDNGKILMVVNGQWQLVSPSVLYTGQGLPNNSQGNNGDLYIQTD